MKQLETKTKCSTIDGLIAENSIYLTNFLTTLLCVITNLQVTNFTAKLRQTLGLRPSNSSEACSQRAVHRSVTLQE
jgi:hypothetical protein